MKRILCPVDFSDGSINALEFAAEVGSVYDSKITLLHVLTEKEFRQVLGETQPSSTYNELVDLAQEKLKALGEEIMRSDGGRTVRCETKLLYNEIAPSILDEARSGIYDLITMGTRGISEFNTRFVGSNSVRVIEKASCPVLLVPAEASMVGFDRMVYATDYLEEDKIVIQSVISFAVGFNSQIQILHISHRDQLVDKALYKEFKTELTSFINYSKVGFERIVAQDRIEQSIDSFVRETKASLLAIVTRRRGFFGRLFHDSLTERMSYFVDYPLLVFNI